MPNKLNAYVEKCGLRSVILQGLLVAWSLLWFVLIFRAGLYHTVINPGDHGMPFTDGLMISVTIWFFFAAFLVIASVATLKEEKGDGE